MELGRPIRGPSNYWPGPCPPLLQKIQRGGFSQSRGRFPPLSPQSEPLNPGWRRQRWVSVAGGSRGLPRGGRRGRKRGVSVGMSVAVLACWRPISQMSFATIKKCGGVKWRFHIQQGKGGVVHLGAGAATAGRGGNTPPPLGSRADPLAPLCSPTQG